MGRRLRISPQTLALLEALLNKPTSWHHGYALSQQTSLASGTLYPILMRLEKLHWLETSWEQPGIGAAAGRPPRHLIPPDLRGPRLGPRRTRRRTTTQNLEASLK